MSLGLTIGNIMASVGDFLGNGPSTRWDAATTADIVRIVHGGLRNFYYPAPLGDQPPHRWSFLRKTSGSMSTSDGVVSLPSDFMAMAGDFILSGGLGRVPVITASEFAALQGADATLLTGTPKYAAIRPVAPTGANEQTWQVAFYPASESETTFSFDYYYNPAVTVVKDGTTYPPGGPQHADTILASCLAVAENEEDDIEGIWKNKFAARLATSITLDVQASSGQATKTWKVAADSPTLDQTYEDLQRAVGHVMGLTSNPNSWNHTEIRAVDAAIAKGLRSFYFPTPANGRSHVWSFLEKTDTLNTVPDYGTVTGTVVDESLYPSGLPAISRWYFNATTEIFDESMVGLPITLESEAYSGVQAFAGTIAAVISKTRIKLSDAWHECSESDLATFSFPVFGGNYALPDDFGGLIGDMTYDYNNAIHTVTVTGEGEIRRLRQFNNRRGAAEYVASRPLLSDGTGIQKHELLVFPTPEILKTLIYKYRCLPQKLSPGQVPLGGMQHAETILAACEAAAGEIVGKPEYQAKFAERLATSVAIDREAMAPEFLGSMNVRTDTASLHTRSGLVTYVGGI